MTSEILTLEGLREKRPNHQDHEIPGTGTFRVARVSLARKLEVMEFLTSHLSEEGALEGDMDTVIHLWSIVMAKCVTDEDGEFVFDCKEGVALIEGIAEPTNQHWREFRDVVDRINGLSSQNRVEEVETAKKE